MKFAMKLFAVLFSASCYAQGIVDTHIHLYSGTVGMPRLDGAAAVSEMDAAGIEKAFVLSFGYALPIQPLAGGENDFVSDEVAKYPGRLFGFCGVDVAQTWAPDEVKRCSQLPGMVGLKLYFTTNNLNLSDAAKVALLISVLEAARDNGLTTVLMHIEWGNMAVLESMILNVWTRFPGLKFILAHGLLQSYEDLASIAWFYERYYMWPKNLYTELSALVEVYESAPIGTKEEILWSLRRFDVGRIFFGTDYVGLKVKPRDVVAMMNQFPFKKAEREGILSTNAYATFDFLNGR